MSSEVPDGNSDRRTAHRARPYLFAVGLLRNGLVGCGLTAIAYLCALAIRPDLRNGAPTWLRWFGQPGSSLTIWVLLAVSLGIFALSRLRPRRSVTQTPVLLLAAMAGLVVVLGMSAFWRCYDNQSQFFAPLAWTLQLFAGSVESRFGPDGGRCAGQLPVALELARLLAIATTLTTALAAALTLFQSQLDRLAIWRARALSVVVDIDDETLSMVRAISRRLASDETLVVLTSNPDHPAVKIARGLGAKIRTAPLHEADALADLRLWRHVDRLYLLSPDAGFNEQRLRAANAAMDRFGDKRLRLPLTVRIDNPWQAEVWRRRFLESREPKRQGALTDPTQNRRWVADAVGRYEITAAKVVRHLLTGFEAVANINPPTTVLLCGLDPLTYALCSEFAQAHREQDLYQKPNMQVPSRVVILADGAASFVEDHHLRQRRMAAGHASLTVEALETQPTIETINDFIASCDPLRLVVILTDTSTETEGTRLATRFPDLTIYQASSTAALLADFSIVGRLYPFPINMELDDDAPQDVWERAAELIHEHYSAGRDRSEWTARPWKCLDPFIKKSNRRALVNALWLVETEGNHTWNTLESSPAQALSSHFFKLTPPQQLEELGFDEETATRMIVREHEDWRRFYEAAGWKYGSQHSDERKVHDRLLPWDELVAMDSPQHGDHLKVEDGAQRSLISTLVNLRNLGYRSMRKLQPADEMRTASSESGWRSYRRVGEVGAEQRSSPWQWRTQRGEVMQAEAGDWAVTDAKGHVRSVAAAIFESTHENIAPGRFRRTGIVLARKVIAPEPVATLEGDVMAQPGDWVVKGRRGELWPVPDERFLTTYEGPTDGAP